MVNGTSQQNNNRRSGRRAEPPQRVANAADQMRNTSPQGSLRYYIPQQTGSQPPVYPAQGSSRQGFHAVPQQQTQAGQRGFGVPAVQTKKKKSTGLKIIIALIVTAVLAGGAYAGVQISKDVAEKRQISEKVSPYDGLYCPGVYVDGIHLGGMTPEQAMNSVTSQISQRNDSWRVQLSYEGRVLADITAGTLKMSVNQNELVNVMNDAWKPGHTGTAAERYEQMKQLEQNPYNAYTAKPSGDTREIDRILLEVKSQIDVAPVDAQVTVFDPSRDYPFLFTDEVTGRILDIEPLRENIYRMMSTMTSGTVELQPEVIRPRQTVAELKTHYALRGSATTPIDRHSEEERNNNIRRCFQLINGYKLMPGKTFSFNKVVGARTVENGFYPAVEYVNDEHVTGIGGGSCQASTTVYQAAVRAGMTITGRKPHSDSVSYAAYGMDATVYMDGKQIDLTFRNDTDEPVYFTAAVVNDPSNKGRLMTKVCMYGKSLGNIRYDLETVTVETLPSIMDPVYVSEKSSVAKAKDGCIVDSYRTIYVDGAYSEREFLFRDRYNPKPEKIYDPSMAR